MDFARTWSFLRAFMVLYTPFIQNGSNHDDSETDGDPIDRSQDQFDDSLALHLPLHLMDTADWFDELLEPDLKWSFALNGVVHAGTSEFQNLNILDTKPFGKALVIDGKLQSAEKDEFIYHESLVHPALLIHDGPRSVFIMGGGEGSTAREILKHKDIEKVIMCDIDREVVNLCREHMSANQEAFNDERLHVVFNDAKDELEKREEKFDVIVGDLCDPIELGPCNHLYTKSFYEHVLKPKLNPYGIFVTQAGPAGMLSHQDIFTPIYNTVKQVFNHVIAYTAHVPSYADTCGWVLASDRTIRLDGEQLNNRIGERIRGELSYHDGPFIVASTVLNKTLQTSLMNETHVITEENARFVIGHGIHNNA